MDGEEVRHLQKNENINSLFIHSCGSPMWEGEGDIYHKQPFYISYFFFSEESLFPRLSQLCKRREEEKRH